jgi:low temperature requirement protein LtrA
MAGGLSSRTGSMQIYTRIHIPLLGALTAVGAGVHMLIQEAATGTAQTGAAWALDGGAALYLLCLTIAQGVTERGADARGARALAGLALVVLAVLAGPLTPVSFVACSAAALVALVAYEIRLGLAEQPGYPDSPATASSIRSTSSGSL